MSGIPQQTGNSRVAVHIPLLQCMEILTQDALPRWATFFQLRLPFWPPQKPCHHKWRQDAVPPRTTKSTLGRYFEYQYLLGTKQKKAHAYPVSFSRPVTNSSRRVLDFDFVGGNHLGSECSGQHYVGHACITVSVTDEASPSLCPQRHF